MEFEQIIKRLDWLDESHRKDRNTIDELAARAENLEAELRAASKQIKELTEQLSDLSTTRARLDQYDTSLSNQRTDLVKYIDDQGRKMVEQSQDLNQTIQHQFNAVNKSITQLGKTKTSITQLSQELKSLSGLADQGRKVESSIGTRLDALTRRVEEFESAFKAADEFRRQDAKRFADLQGDLASARKRLEAAREKNDLVNDTLRSLDTRLNELIASEADRRQAQTRFIEQLSRTQVERDNAWKVWEEQLAGMKLMSEEIEKNLQSWESSQRLIKRAQDAYDEIIQKFERRINEITEMQRLAEDRFRQEWVSFKADDQKRWTSFTLSQGETQKDALAGMARLEGRITDLQDQAHSQQDTWQQTQDANEQLLLGLMSQLQELLATYARIMDTR